MQTLSELLTKLNRKFLAFRWRVKISLRIYLENCTLVSSNFYTAWTDILGINICTALKHSPKRLSWIVSCLAIRFVLMLCMWLHSQQPWFFSWNLPLNIKEMSSDGIAWNSAFRFTFNWLCDAQITRVTCENVNPIDRSVQKHESNMVSFQCYSWDTQCLVYLNNDICHVFI